MDGLEIENKPADDFKASLDEVIAQPQEAIVDKPKRGRPKKVIEPPKLPNPIPPRMENKDFAQLIKGMANSFIKEDRIKLTDEESLRLSAPYYQLYVYYLPFAGGIGGVWIDALVITAAIGISKFQIAKEIMDNERGKKDNINIGDEGNGQVNESKGVVEGTITGDNL